MTTEDYIEKYDIQEDELVTEFNRLMRVMYAYVKDDKLDKIKPHVKMIAAREIAMRKINETRDSGRDNILQ